MAQKNLKINAFTFKQNLVKLDNSLFNAERAAIFLFIILPNLTPTTIIYFIVTSSLHTQVPLLLRRVGTSLAPKYVDYFVLERLASLALMLYFHASYGIELVAFYAITTTLSGCILNFMPWLQIHENGISCPNPRELLFLLERLLAIVFIFYPSPRCASFFAGSFCYAGVLHLILSALPLDANPKPTGTDYVFWIEHAAAIALKLHCSTLAITIAVAVFLVTNCAYLADSLESRQKSGQKKPKQSPQMKGIVIKNYPLTILPNFREASKIDQSEKEEAKVENAPPKRKLAVEEELRREEIQESSRLEEEVLVESGEELIEESSQIEEDLRNKEDNELESDDSWEKVSVEADDEVAEIATSAEGSQYVERLKAENDELRTKMDLLKMAVAKERQDYEQGYHNKLKKMQEEFVETLVLERQFSSRGYQKRPSCSTSTKKF